MSANPPLHLGVDIASCARTVSVLREIAVRLRDVDPPAARAAHALSTAVHEFTESMRETRGTAFRAEQAAAEAGLRWRGRAVVAPPDRPVDPQALAEVRSLVGCVLSSGTRANAGLLARCTQTAQELASGT